MFVEFNPEIAYDKLMNLGDNANYKERLSYLKHLAELVTIIGERVLLNLSTITNFVVPFFLLPNIKLV